ncbi:MAG TPA: MaoC family dehydratase [Stellaceae bacterium]|jgi:acyl dehydratase
MTFRYFEDFRVGEKTDLGRYPVTEPEILAFARQYDPQRMHTDRDFAARTSFGGLIASGWHSCAMFMRLLVDAMLMESSAIASPGVDSIRWIRPVRAGDVLRAEAEVIEIAPSHSRRDRGLVKHDCKVFNQQDELVMTLRTLALFGRRPPSGTLPGPGAAS